MRVLIAGVATEAPDISPSAPDLQTELLALSARFILDVDWRAGTIRARLLSPGDFVDQEYLLAYDDAVKYRDAGYAGEVPAGVQTWAAAKGESALWAADNIIEQREIWKTASDSIRSIRLLGKESVRSAAEVLPDATVDILQAAISATQAAYDTVIAQFEALSTQLFGG